MQRNTQLPLSCICIGKYKHYRKCMLYGNSLEMSVSFLTPVCSYYHGKHSCELTEERISSFPSLIVLVLVRTTASRSVIYREFFVSL